MYYNDIPISYNQDGPNINLQNQQYNDSIINEKNRISNKLSNTYTKSYTADDYSVYDDSDIINNEEDIEIPEVKPKIGAKIREQILKQSKLSRRSIIPTRTKRVTK